MEEEKKSKNFNEYVQQYQGSDHLKKEYASMFRHFFRGGERTLSENAIYIPSPPEETQNGITLHFKKQTFSKNAYKTQTIRFMMILNYWFQYFDQKEYAFYIFALVYLRQFRYYNTLIQNLTKKDRKLVLNRSEFMNMTMFRVHLTYTKLKEFKVEGVKKGVFFMPMYMFYTNFTKPIMLNFFFLKKHPYLTFDGKVFKKIKKTVEFPILDPKTIFRWIRRNLDYFEREIPPLALLLKQGKLKEYRVGLKEKIYDKEFVSKQYWLEKDVDPFGLYVVLNYELHKIYVEDTNITDSIVINKTDAMSLITQSKNFLKDILFLLKWETQDEEKKIIPVNRDIVSNWTVKQYFEKMGFTMDFTKETKKSEKSITTIEKILNDLNFQYNQLTYVTWDEEPKKYPDIVYYQNGRVSYTFPKNLTFLRNVMKSSIKYRPIQQKAEEIILSVEDVHIKSILKYIRRHDKIPKNEFVDIGKETIYKEFIKDGLNQNVKRFFEALESDIETFVPRLKKFDVIIKKLNNVVDHVKTFDIMQKDFEKLNKGFEKLNKDLKTLFSGYYRYI